MERIKKIGPWVAIAIAVVVVLSLFAQQRENSGVLATLKSGVAGMSEAMATLTKKVAGIGTKVTGVETGLTEAKTSLEAGLDRNARALSLAHTAVDNVNNAVAQLRRDMPAIAGRAATTALAQEKCGVTVDGLGGRCTKACLAYLAGELVEIPPDCLPQLPAEAAVSAPPAKKAAPKAKAAEPFPAPALVAPPPAPVPAGGVSMLVVPPAENPLADVTAALGEAKSAASEAKSAASEAKSATRSLEVKVSTEENKGGLPSVAVPQ